MQARLFELPKEKLYTQEELYIMIQEKIKLAREQLNKLIQDEATANVDKTDDDNIYNFCSNPEQTPVKKMEEEIENLESLKIILENISKGGQDLRVQTASEDFMFFLINILKLNSKLEFLKFQDSLPSNSFERLINTLKANHLYPIQALDFSFCKLGPDDAKIIADLLTNNNRIQCMQLMGDRIGDEGAKLILSSLHDDNTLETLDFRATGLTDVSIDQIINLLIKNSKITTLWIDRNNFNNTALEKLVVFAEKNQRVIDFDMRDEEGKYDKNLIKRCEALAKQGETPRPQ